MNDLTPRKARQLDHCRLRLREAQAFVAAYHRHSAPLKRHFFSIGAIEASRRRPLLGVATVDTCSSHAWSRRADFIELRRLCTLGDDNVASFLIGKVCQACFAIGYRTIVTYTQPHESGASLKAAGFMIEKRARITGSTSAGVAGGLVRWTRIRDYEQTPEDRDFTREVLSSTHAFVRKWAKAG